ncbi:MAG: glutaredoxin 3 [Hydrogenophaga sp.]|jgi:glutaredoxin 3|uniref:glutaredoxin 3 n=1 Tax=Hydrogenophaga sp. TaxID=1904254 RepID=UPI000EE3FBD8|nr:glutaredoxin 3 [Hydrogenophaga sp.]MDD3784888.1 glutaredoxin 3 [Hydrogenophaga sp.]MDX9967925.1 glutaredoxin 3 [Hydrogenophaga sp.]HAJ12317.1 glutaredoxin 3 [Comamonadaceae bacterium]
MAAQVKIYSSDYCPYCMRAKALLQARGVTDYEEIVVDGRPDVRATMTEITGRTSVPQIFIGDRHVGGCDDLHALDARGALAPLLAA